MEEYNKLNSCMIDNHIKEKDIKYVELNGKKMRFKTFKKQLEEDDNFIKQFGRSWWVVTKKGTIYPHGLFENSYMFISKQKKRKRS